MVSHASSISAMSAVAVAGAGESATIADGPRMPLWPIATPPEKVMSAMTGITTTHSQRPQPLEAGTPAEPEPRLETGAAGTAKPGPSTGSGGGTASPKADWEGASAPSVGGAGGMNGRGASPGAAGLDAGTRSEESVM